MEFMKQLHYLLYYIKRNVFVQPINQGFHAISIFFINLLKSSKLIISSINKKIYVFVW